MKKFSVICLIAFIGIFCACNKSKPVALSEIELEVNDTVEYYYDQSIKCRFVCSVDCNLPVDVVCWHMFGDGFDGQSFRMQEKDGKYYCEDVFCDVCAGLIVDYNYRIFIGDWVINSKSFHLHVQQSDLDSIVP